MIEQALLTLFLNSSQLRVHRLFLTRLHDGAKFKHGLASFRSVATEVVGCFPIVVDKGRTATTYCLTNEVSDV